jgi:hypothetical protein
VECNKVDDLPDIEITMGGKLYRIPPRTYIVHFDNESGSSSEENKRVCMVGIEEDT